MEIINVDQASNLRKMIQNAAMDKAKNSAIGKDGPRVFSITSGKGGVGKTNITGNLALALSNMGKKVLIFDADLGLANIDIIFGIHPKYNIGHVISGEKDLSEVIVETKNGIGIIPAASGEKTMTGLETGQKLSLLSEFEVLNEIFDVVLIDTAAGISSDVIYFNLAAEECIVIATGEPTSITDAYGIMKVLNQSGAKRFKLLINMVKDSSEAKTVYFTLSQAVDRFLNGVVTEFLGYIPFDAKVSKSVIERKPVLINYPESSAGKSITLLAKKLLDSPRRKDLDGNIKFFMQRLLNID